MNVRVALAVLRLAQRASVVAAATAGSHVIGAEAPSAAYPPGAAAVLANHEAVAQQWYQALAVSQPAPPPLILRLNILRCFGNTSLMMEYVNGAGMPREARLWETSRRMALSTADCSKLTVAGTPESGSVGGELRLSLPDDTSGSTNEFRIEINGKIAAGKVQGSFRASVMAAKTDGVLTGSALAPAAAAKTTPVRGLPSVDFETRIASESYTIASMLERDACLMYRGLRAMAAVRGDRNLFVEAFRTNEIPMPIRKTFDSPAVAAAAAAAAAKPGAGKPKVTKPGSGQPVTMEFDVDALSGVGLESDSSAAASTPAAAPKTDKPETVKARLPLLQAMVAYTGNIRAAGQAHLADATEAPVQRGLTFDDPLFGPWYGAGSLASWTGAVNRLPSDVGAPGFQDWPFVHAWQSLGPFGFGLVNWDPVRLPDCLPVPDTEFAGKIALVCWKPTQTAPSGCALFSDVDLYAAALEEIEDEPVSPAPRRLKGRTAVYYGATTIEAEREAEVIMAAGCTGYIGVWHDGVLVASGPETENPENITQETLLFRLKFHKGSNRILVRCDAQAYGLFSHRRPGTATYFWMRACVRGAPGDAKASRDWMDEVAKRKKDLPNLPTNVRGFRGDQTGFFPDADPPTAWDLDRGINVRWHTPIEHWSKAAPTVVGDKVFVCADPHVLICLDALSGKILWRRAANVLELIAPAKFQESEKLHQAYLDAQAALAPKLAELGPDYAARLRSLEAQGKELPRAAAGLREIEGEAERKYGVFAAHLTANGKLVKTAWDGSYHGPWWTGYSFATPVTDGKRVYVKFHTGVTAAYDLGGNRIWMVNTPFELGGATECASPVLADDKLIVPAARDPKTSDAKVVLTALDAATGRSVWKAKADSRSQISSPVVMRLTDGKQDMTVVVTDGGTVVRADDGKVLVAGLRGSSGSGTPTPVGDILYRVELSQGGGVQFVMLDRDHVGARWTWHQSLYNAIYAGVGHCNGILFGTTHGGSQCMNARGLDLIDAGTGLPIERPFNLPVQTKQKGIFIAPRGGFVPPVASPRAVYVATRGQWHGGSVEEEVARKWTPYAFVSVAQHGGLGRFIAHNKVVGPLTPNLTLVGDRVYVRNDFELSCFGYTGDEGRAYEAEINAETILEDVSDTPPSDTEGAALWKRGILYARPFLEKAMAMKPECAAAVRAKSLLEKVK